MMAGSAAKIGRIDGQVRQQQRSQLLKQCQILIMTPDVIHAWLLSNLSDTACRQFMMSLQLIIVDEVHTYSGVFGSNAAFLFRRIRHLLSLYNSEPRFLSASATISDPDAQLQKLFGVPFTLIGKEFDTSPKHGVDLVFLKPPGMSDPLTETAQFLARLAQEKSKFIAFVDSRKQTEQIATILSREKQEHEEDPEDAEWEIAAAFDGSHLTRFNILPYRAGYEERDRTLIQQRLSRGTLQGVVSTSALELGLDISDLDAAVLVGVPSSSTSLFQRIGRIGRHGPGTVYIIHTGGFSDELVFRRPESLLERPPAESALYLDNPRIQYIHALCLARIGGEHDQASGGDDSLFVSKIDWPHGFLDVCKAERIGAISPELQQMKAEAGDDPNHVFPLRDVESSFKVELKQGPEQRDLGNLSFSQVLRETYPGAVYYYTTQAFRVYKVLVPSKTVMVRKERHYTTKPRFQPTLVFPNLSEGNVYASNQYAKMVAVECHLQIRESVSGYKERRGPSEINVNYPLSVLETNIYYSHPRFTRNYFSTGVVLTHPAFQHCSRDAMEQASKLIFEAFLFKVPLERQDVNIAVDRHRMGKEPYFQEGDRFIAFYDQTYGSLRLSGKLLEEQVLRSLFEQALEIATVDPGWEATEETINLLEQLHESVQHGRREVQLNATLSSDHHESEQYVRVIAPGSTGMALVGGNREYQVESVFYSPRQNGLCYRGRYVDQEKHDTSTIILSIASVMEIPGESRMARYDMETGEIEG
jgi:DEAD/DEAH box helicase domain-containing protein